MSGLVDFWAVSSVSVSWSLSGPLSGKGRPLGGKTLPTLREITPHTHSVDHRQNMFRAVHVASGTFTAHAALLMQRRNCTSCSAAASATEARPPSLDAADAEPTLAEILGLDHLLDPLSKQEVDAITKMRIALDALYAGLEGGLAEVSPADQSAIDSSGGHSAWGELTVRGAHSVLSWLFGPESEPHKPHEPHAKVLYDLGSGASRFIAQACLERPGLRGVGVELGTRRHEAAAAASRRSGWPPLAIARHDDMLNTPMDDCTHLYVAPLTFDEAFMERLGARLAALPRLQVVATLKRFPSAAAPGGAGSSFAATFEEDESARKRMAEVTWGVARVFVYRRRTVG